MRLILDTDHLSVLQHRNQPAFDKLQERLRGSDPTEHVVTVVTFQEQVQGWLSYINGARTSEEILRGYANLLGILRDFSRMTVLPFDQAAQDCFAKLRSKRLRLGTQDLRIASIALTTNSTLLTRNLRDFGKVPNLLVEDWTR